MQPVAISGGGGGGAIDSGGGGGLAIGMLPMPANVCSCMLAAAEAAVAEAAIAAGGG